MTSGSPSTTDKRRAFRDLHVSGCFVIPNPWNLGTAKYLQKLGFKALATTSSGSAWSQGLPDGKLSRDQALEHFESLAAATDLPVNADFESGYAKNVIELAENVALAVRTGIAGLSIEDSTGEADRPLHDMATAVDRIRTARRAIDKAGGDAMLRAAQTLGHEGRFDGFKDAASGAALDECFRQSGQ